MTTARQKEAPKAAAKATAASKGASVARAKSEAQAEVDDLFASKKASPAAGAAPGTAADRAPGRRKRPAAVVAGPPPAKEKAVEAIADLRGTRHTKRPMTEDGLPIYSAAEMRINMPNAGNSADCPFDCECCF